MTAREPTSGGQNVPSGQPEQPIGEEGGVPDPRLRDETTVHTCHAECPCQTGGEPPRDFIPAEGSLLPGLFAMARLRQRIRDVEEKRDA